VLRGLGPSLVCVHSSWGVVEQRFDITGLPLKVPRNRLHASGPLLQRATDRSKAGDIVDWSEEEFHAFPPLGRSSTVAALLRHNQPTHFRDVDCQRERIWPTASVWRQADHRIRQSWPTGVNLRPHEREATAGFAQAAVSEASVHTGRMSPRGTRRPPDKRASQSLFTRPPNQRDMFTATGFLEPGADLLVSGMPKERMERGPQSASLPALE